MTYQGHIQPIIGHLTKPPINYGHITTYVRAHIMMYPTMVKQWTREMLDVVICIHIHVVNYVTCISM